MKKLTDDDFRLAAKTSFSVRQAISKLNLKPAGGNYQTFRKKVKELNIDISHFTGQLWCKGKKAPLKIPLEQYLNNERSIQSVKLKARLLREGVMSHVCSECKLTEWLGQPIPIELDHIDGNTENNTLSNLRLLCPNCHAQTPNYRGKNIGKYST